MLYNYCHSLDLAAICPFIYTCKGIPTNIPAAGAALAKELQAVLGKSVCRLQKSTHSLDKTATNKAAWSSLIPTRGEFLLAKHLEESGGINSNMRGKFTLGTCSWHAWDASLWNGALGQGHWHTALKPPGLPAAAHGKGSCRTAGCSETPRWRKGHPQEGPLHRLKRKKEGSIHSDLHGNQGEVGNSLI